MTDQKTTQDAQEFERCVAQFKEEMEHLRQEIVRLGSREYMIMEDMASNMEDAAFALEWGAGRIEKIASRARELEENVVAARRVKKRRA